MALFVSGLSAAIAVPPVPARAQGGPQQLARGDADLNGRLELTDAVNVLSFLFLGGELRSCLAIADATGNGALDLTDPISVLNFLFLGGPAPPALSGFENRTCQPADPTSIEEGRAVYSSPDPESENQYAFSCATCHSDLPAGEETIRMPGHTLFDAVRRPHFKNGQVATFLGAANVCRTDWMLTRAWADADEDFLDLVSYLHSIAPPGPAPAYTYAIRPPSRQGPTTGIAQAGCELFHNACVICHGPSAGGTPRGPQLLFPQLGEPSFDDPDFIREQVRLSGPMESVYEGLIGGVMPFWTPDRLSDAELEDLVAYLMSFPTPECEGSGG